MDRLTIATWKWGTLYGPDAINHLHFMLDRHLKIPHEVVCFTDDAKGLHPKVRSEALPYFHPFRALRRAKILDRDMERWLGPRFVQMDLDVIISRDITPLLERGDRVACWRRPRGHYNPSLLMMDTGALGHIWDTCKQDPMAYIQEAKREGWSLNPSDETVLNYGLFGPYRDLWESNPVSFWTHKDGVVRFDWPPDEHGKEHHRIRKVLHPSARITFFVGYRNKRYIAPLYDSAYPGLRDAI